MSEILLGLAGYFIHVYIYFLNFGLNYKFVVIKSSHKAYMYHHLLLHLIWKQRESNLIIAVVETEESICKFVWAKGTLHKGLSKD